jgi:hypothetical protein
MLAGLVVLAGSLPAQGAITDDRCPAPSSGSVTTCINGSTFTDDNGDGIPDVKWEKGIEGELQGSDLYRQWVVDGLSKHQITPNKRTHPQDVGIVRSFPLSTTGETYQACALAKVYDQVEPDPSSDAAFSARVTIAQKQGNDQVKNPSTGEDANQMEANVRLEFFSENFIEISTEPFTLRNSAADNVAVKFRAHTQVVDSGGVAVLKQIKFLRLPNNTSGESPRDCFPGA